MKFGTVYGHATLGVLLEFLLLRLASAFDLQLFALKSAPLHQAMALTISDFVDLKMNKQMISMFELVSLPM